MKPETSTGRPARLQYGFAAPARRSRPPNTPFRDTAPLGTGLDEGCWIETAGRGAVEIHSMTRRLEDIDE